MDEKENASMPLFFRGGDETVALAIAARFGFTLTRERPEADAPFLVFDESGLALSAGGQEVRGDFSRMLPRLSKKNLMGESLVRAVKLRDCPCPLIVDATAGLGEDSLLLAASGCTVLLYEYDTAVAALLSDALRRAESNVDLAPAIARMTLTFGDSIAALPTLSPDVVYLDPMFPKRQKSGLVKKKFQVIHLVESPCDRENELFLAALAAHPRKIVVKRPEKAAYLAERKPSYQIFGKSIRYDCYVLS